ncbi:MAG: aminopeptidase P family protein [Solirubrobacterales bacterium]
MTETSGGSTPANAAASTRPERLSQAVAAGEIDALLVTRLVNVGYLTGFSGTNAACLIGPDIRIFLTDFRYADRAATEIDGWDVEIVPGEWLGGVASQISGSVPDGRVGIEDDHVTVRTRRLLSEKLAGGTSLTDCGGMVEHLRRSKDADEIAAIAAAAELTDSIYTELFERGLTGRTEADIAGFVVGRMREHGAEPSFTPIIAAGPNGASPHAEPGSRKIEAGELVVIDMGSKLHGYCSDCTRTVATGQLEAQAAEIYEVTLRANESALEAVAAGRAAVEIDAVARDLITEAGYGEKFGHGLGHGVGLEIHEAPRLGPRSDDVLVEGDVVTVEPGIYLSGKFGVRIEDLVVVSAGGISQNLSSHPKELAFLD